MSGTSTKKLENGEGKGFSVSPEGVKIYAQEGLKLQLSKSGVLIKSNTDITIEGKDHLRIIGKNVRITAKEKLTIKGGSNSINMKENGTIEFAGTKLNMLVSETSEESGFDEKPRQLTPTVIYEEDKIKDRAIKDDKDVEIEEIPLANDIALSKLLKKVPSATFQAIMRGAKAVGKVKEKNDMEDFFEETSESSDGDDKVSDKKYDRPTPGEETMPREVWVKYYRSMPDRNAVRTFEEDVLDLWNNEKVLYRIELSIDCSEIAEDFLEAADGEGKIYHITPKSGMWMEGIEYGEIKPFTYHDVYSDGKYIYDPRYSDSRISEKDYFSKINKLNPNGLNVEKNGGV